MITGLQQKLVWLVVNLDFLLPVPAGPQVVLEGEEFIFCRTYGNMIGLSIVHTPFAEKEGSGHAATTELSPRNVIIEHHG